MDSNAILLAAFAAGLLLGGVTVGLLQRRSGRSARERAEQLTAEIDATREEFESHREEVAQHFARTSDLFRDLTEQYTLLYSHLTEGAREFCTDDEPALARGLDTPLLAHAGEASEPEPAREEAGREESPNTGERSAEQTNGGARSALA
jgi:uncharacterized membrane-anchored protein YhcB (DUF1043 family)